MASTPLMQLSGLKKRFGDIQAVNDVSLSVNRGEVIGFLGPNGAGKTTTMRLATGFLLPDAGDITLNGVRLDEDPLNAKAAFGYVPEGSPLYTEMTPQSFLEFVAAARGLDKADDAVARVKHQTGLDGVMDQRIETLSKGYKRRVGLAQALLHDPPVLFLDEPTDGLDPNQKHQMRELLKEMAKDKAIVISTHILEEVESVCTRVVLIHQGKILIDTTPKELAKKQGGLEAEFRRLTQGTDHD